MPTRPMTLLAAAVVCLLVLVVTIGSNTDRGTQAAFADDARATTAPFSAAVLAPPTKPTCAVLILPTRVRFTWTGGTGQYVYTVTNGTTTIASGGPTSSTTFTREVALLDIGTSRFSVRSVYPGSTWVSAPVTRDYSVVTGLITSCGA